MSLNATPIPQLRPQDLAWLAKPLGVPGLPYPTLQYGLAKDGKVVEYLRVIESHDQPMVVYSTRPADQVMGEMVRDMPIPSMLPIVEEGLLRRHPEHRNKTLFMIGEAGFGKSHLTKLIARVRDPQGALVIDCGDRNLNDLLFETTLDMGEDLRQAIDAHLRKATLSPARIKLLEDGLGNAFIKGRTSHAIDWEAIGHPALDKGRPQAGDSLSQAQSALEALETFCRLEGIALHQATSLGLRMREGELIRAYKEGREVLLDEYNKSKEGTDRGLQTILQFLNGEIDEAVVENKLKVYGREETYRFTFCRSEMPIGFFVTLTGNDVKDGTMTRLLARSVHSRLHPVRIGSATVLDWQHRISQILTGLPLSTLYRMHAIQAEQDPEAFAQELLALRRLGLSASELAAIPPLQLRLLAQWQRTLKAVETLADFYSHWSEITNPDAPLFEKKEFGRIADEIDGYYRDEVCIDFRRAIKDITAALHQRPRPKDFRQAGGLSVVQATTTRHVDLDLAGAGWSSFGTQLARTIVQTIGNTTLGKPHLRQHLVTLAGDLGILQRPFREARRSERPSLSQLLDLDPFEHVGGSLSLAAIRRLLSTYFLQQESTASATPLPSLPDVARVAEELLTQQPSSAADHGWVAVVSSERILELAGLTDLAVPESVAPTAGEDLVAADVLAASLALRLPRYAPREALWAVAEWQEILLTRQAEGATRPGPEAITLVDGSGEEGLRLTSLRLRHPHQPSPVGAQLLVQPEAGGVEHMLLVAEGFSPELQEQLHSSHITLVNRDQPRAAERVRTWLADHVEPHPTAPSQDSLVAALALRNQWPAKTPMPSLAELLVDPSLQPTWPVVLRRMA